MSYNKQDKFRDLRLKAEQLLEKPELDKDETKKLLHELQVYQIELELQNEELQESQLQLSSSQQKYLNLFHKSPVSYLVTDSNGTILEANHTFLELLGYTSDYVLSKPFNQFSVREDALVIFNQIKLLGSNYEDTSFTIRLKSSSGQMLTFQVKGRRITGQEFGQNTSTTLFFNLVNITREKELEAKTIQLERFIKLTPDPVLIIEESGKLVFANESAYVNLEITKVQLDMHNFLEFLEQENPESTFKYMLQNADKSGIIRAELEIKGSLKNIQAHALMFPFGQTEKGNKLFGIVLHDITILKESEKKQRELEAKSFAFSKTEALGRIASGVAHHMNNKLYTIILSTSLLKEAAVNLNEAEEYVDIIQKASEQSAELITHLLNYAVPETLGKENFSLSQCIESVIELASVTNNREIKFVSLNGLQSDLVYGNYNQIQEVLLNVLLNACNAVEEQPDGSVSITLRNSIDQEHPLIIEIEDNGHGIQEEILPNIFDPFYTTDTTGQKAGMGLSVVKSLLEENGGKIEIDSVSGEGTRMQLYFKQN
jgi:PAS domain S-box-containing protein